jgi:hypothetical protein
MSFRDSQFFLTFGIYIDPSFSPFSSSFFNYKKIKIKIKMTEAKDRINTIKQHLTPAQEYSNAVE